MRRCIDIMCLLQLGVFVKSARILAIVPTASFSHQVAFRPLWQELLARGHHLVLLTTDSMDELHSTNLTEINLRSLYNIWRENQVYEQINSLNNNPFAFIQAFETFRGRTTDYILRHREVQELIHNKDEFFDVVIAETSHPALLAFKYRFSCPLIGIVSMEAPFYLHRLMGNPVHPVLYPERALPFTDNLNFFQRLYSLSFQLFIMCYRHFYIKPQQQELVKMHFSNISVTIDELEQSIDMLFTYVNPIFQGFRPLGTRTITFGRGPQDYKAKTLSKDIDEFLNNATKGAIYFSLGTNVKSQYLSNTDKMIFMEAFKELPYKVVWKVDDDQLPNSPYNVKVVQWVPQEQLLRHPTIKVFITHAGLRSVEEAIYSHVPMIAIPFFGDQQSNAFKIESKGMGLVLNHQTLTKDGLKQAICQILKNHKKYSDTVKKIAELSSDFPKTGAAKAAWWTEYVIKHQGAHFLKFDLNANFPRDVVTTLIVYTCGIIVFGVFGILSFKCMQRIGKNCLRRK